MSRTRILVAIDVDTADAAAEYGGTIDNLDLAASVEARLDEFYPGADGYLVTKSVTAVVVDRGDFDRTPDAAALEGIYNVGTGV